MNVLLIFHVTLPRARDEFQKYKADGEIHDRTWLVPIER